VLVAALFGAMGFMWWHHRVAVQDRQRTAEFAAAARRGVIDMMSIDFTTADQGVQRVIDDSTGQLKKGYQDSGPQMIKAIRDDKVVTKVTVTAAAVESMSRDSAVVLVAARTERHNAQDPHDQPATWRMTVTLDRVGGRPKMSNVDFMR
jgi:Mce-associated membrane protein